MQQHCSAVSARTSTRPISPSAECLLPEQTGRITCMPLLIIARAIKLIPQTRRSFLVPALAGPARLLNWRARYIAIGAEDATTSGLRLHAIAAALAVVEVQARIGRHGLARRVSALGARNRR